MDTHADTMILIGLGGNLPFAGTGPPRVTLEAALDELQRAGVTVIRRSSWHRTAPVPPSGQPDFTNGVAVVTTALDPGGLLALLLATEARFGRTRDQPGAARTLDLDLLAYGDLVTWGEARAADPPELPHPRMHERSFVLVPLVDIAPDWRHPALGRTAAELLARLPPDETVRRLEDPH